MTKQATFITLLILNLMFSCALAHEQQTLEIGTIEIVPYGIRGSTADKGFYYEVANRIAQETGYRSNNKISPYARVIFELKTGEIDLSILFKYKELEEHVIYIAPLPALKTVVVGLKGIEFNSIEQLKFKTLAYLRGAKFSDSIDRDPDIKKMETVHFQQAVKMLKFGRVDAIIGPMDPILSSAFELGESDDFFGTPLVVSERTPWVQLSKKSTQKFSTKRLRSSFEALSERKEIIKIRNKYIRTIPTSNPLNTSESLPIH